MHSMCPFRCVSTGLVALRCTRRSCCRTTQKKTCLGASQDNHMYRTCCGCALRPRGRVAHSIRAPLWVREFSPARLSHTPTITMFDRQNTCGILSSLRSRMCIADLLYAGSSSSADCTRDRARHLNFLLPVCVDLCLRLCVSDLDTMGSRTHRLQDIIVAKRMGS